MLRELRTFRGTEHLIPFSGIQFLDFGFREGELGAVRSGQRPGVSLTFAELPDDSALDAFKLRQIDRDPETGKELDHETKEGVTSTATYNVSARIALDYFDGAWLPLPFFKLLDHRPKGSSRFETGPTNWARIRVKKLAAPDEAGNTHRATLAFDTAIALRADPARYQRVRSDDVRLGAFMLADDIVDISAFLREPDVENWLKFSFERGIATAGGRRVTRADGQPAGCAFWAAYAVLLKTFATACNPPRLSFIDTVSGTLSQKKIDVDLVLDIGNSRTCGVLIESAGGGKFDLRYARALELRDLSEPTQVYDRPFASHTEFVQADFGPDNNRTTFDWPSPVRVGPEAIRLNSLSTGAEGSTGLSAPKRYLWDDREIAQQWYFNSAMQGDRAAPSPVGGEVMVKVTMSGEVRSEIRGQTFPAAQPKFSRASLFTFTVCELVFQALCQINSIHLRSQRTDPNAPRQLRRIILTIPTATPLVEREQFERRAKAGVTLLWDIMGWSDPKRQDGAGAIPARPEIEIAYDEATCTQIFYLQDQLVRRFQETPGGFMSSPGLTRRKTPDGTLRIASLDIGGGTTDLMILSYALDSTRTTFVPRQEFREGFRRAGDDILKAVVVDHVMPAIERGLAAAGIPDAHNFLQEAWAAGADDATVTHKRKLFLSRALAPVALGLLSQLESAELGQRPLDDRPFASFFEDGAIDPATFDFLDVAARDAGYRFRMCDVLFPVDFDRLNATVAKAIGGIIDNLCSVIRLFDCDYVLLTGRPSKLPIFKELVMREMPTDPNRIVFMHDYDVGPWYPFGQRGKVGDPKTTVVVGALVATLAEGKLLEHFSIESAAFTRESTANFVGVLTPGGELRNVDVKFKKTNGIFPDLSQPVPFAGPVLLGSRQLEDETWPANPLYRLSWKDDKGPDERLRASTPWGVELTTAAARSDQDQAEATNSERLIIDGISDREGQPVQKNRLELRLHTMLESDGHWLDTGTLDFN